MLSKQLTKRQATVISETENIIASNVVALQKLVLHSVLIYLHRISGRLLQGFGRLYFLSRCNYFKNT
jgi:hypothetical protein